MTSVQKSDVTIVFPDPDFLQDAGISVIRNHLRQILRFSFLHGFSGPLGQKWDFKAENRGRNGAILTPNELVLTFGGLHVCIQFGENRRRNATMRVSTDGQTVTHTHRRKTILLSVPCYML